MTVWPTSGRRAAPARSEARTAWLFVTPAVALVALVALVPVTLTFWESLHRHDLRLPWLGRPFVGAGHYVEALADARFAQALWQTLGFTAVSVALEMAVGLGLALALHRARRLRGLLRTAVLLPWAVPTVVAALAWRFLFEGQQGAINVLLAGAGLLDAPVAWFAHPWAAWVPIVLADVWKTSPFVALLLLAGLQTIDESLYEAARIDGATPGQQFVHVTWPLLRPAMLVALVFRTLDAFRVFDAIYVLTGGGPGTATESLSVYAYAAFFQYLRFGYGSTLAFVVFGVTFVLALAYVRLLGGALVKEDA